MVAGTLMVGWGISAIATQQGIRLGLGSPTVSPRWQRTLGRLLQRVRRQPVGVRALLTGLGTTLLPCGWLYVFVATAGGTGTVSNGMLVMALFWLGTVPALVAVGLGAQRVFGPLRRKLPTLGAVTVMLMGLLALSGRLVMSPERAHVHELAPSVLGAAVPADSTDTTDRGDTSRVRSDHGH